ncbi:MAG: hypothetical protein ACFCU1_08490 [Sumerlaeia bacterium]
MKTAFLLSTLAIASVCSAQNLGIIDSEGSYSFVAPQQNVSTEVSGKQLLQKGQIINSGESMVRAYSAESDFFTALSPESTVSVLSSNSYELIKGSVVVNGKDFSVLTNNLTIASSTSSSTAVIHHFGENEVSINSIEGTLNITDAEGKTIATLSDEQSLVLVKNEAAWTPQPIQTGAPSFSKFFSQVDGGETGPQQTVEENDEDRRKFLPLLLIGGGVVAAGGTTYLIVNEINDDDDSNDDNEDEDSFQSPFIIGGSSAFVQ